jgi:hypothetical protein
VLKHSDKLIEVAERVFDTHDGRRSGAHERNASDKIEFWEWRSLEDEKRIKGTANANAMGLRAPCPT